MGTEGARLMALFAKLIVLFDLRLFQDAQGNEVFGQGFPWEQSLPHNLERRRKLKKKKEGKKTTQKGCVEGRKSA